MIAEILDFPGDPARPRSTKYELRLVPLDLAALKGAVCDEDGLALSVNQHARAFDAANPIGDAEHEYAHGKTRIEQLERDLTRLTAKRAKTNIASGFFTEKLIANQSRLQKGLAFLYCGGSLAALLLSNIVGSDFVAGSGSDVFAANPLGAKCFYFLPILAAIMIKAREHKLPDDEARNRFHAFFFALGFSAFLVWTVMSAIAFAPESATADWLAAAHEDWLTAHSGIILLVSHILVDTAGGYVIASSAMSILLADRVPYEDETISHNWLRRAERDMKAEINAINEAIGAAKTHLQQVADARLALEDQVRLAFHRLATIRESDQRAATSAFLNS